MEIKCPFWPICGAALIRQYQAQQSFPHYGDPQGDHITTVCSDENRYLICEHYKIRSKPKDAEEVEELAQEKKREIIVPIPYTFDSLTKILRKGGLLVKNSWSNIEPSQEEVDSVIASIEEAADILKQKHWL